MGYKVPELMDIIGCEIKYILEQSDGMSKEIIDQMKIILKEMKHNCYDMDSSRIWKC